MIVVQKNVLQVKNVTLLISHPFYICELKKEKFFSAEKQKWRNNIVTG